MAKRELIAFPTDISDFCVAVLHTSEEPERLAWLLDNTLSSSFWLLNDPFVVSIRKKNSTHVCYYCHSETEEAKFWLIEDADKLVKVRPKADFLLVVHGETAKEIMEQCLFQIKTINPVNLAYMLPEENTNSLSWLPWLLGYPGSQTENDNDNEEL